MQGEIQVLLNLLDEAYEREAWHGPNLKGSVRRVKLEEACWRPGDDQRNIWEITVHTAYWKYIVWRRLTGGRRGGFPRKGSNWFVRPSDPSDSWPEDVKLLDETHRQLRESIAALAADDLTLTPGESKLTNAEIIQGIALHDVYHAGQIQTLRQLYARRL